ncbi:MAG: hypothetical protein SPL30_08940 [Succinivibrio sp.]|nr:hypothetical protein [Succinivibrio sp.]
MKKVLLITIAFAALLATGCETLNAMVEEQRAKELAAAEAQKPKPAPVDPKVEAQFASLNVVDHGPCKDCIFSSSYNDPQPKRYTVIYNGKTIRCREFPTGSDRYLCN